MKKKKEVPEIILWMDLKRNWHEEKILYPYYVIQKEKKEFLVKYYSTCLIHRCYTLEEAKEFVQKHICMLEGRNYGEERKKASD